MSDEMHPLHDTPEAPAAVRDAAPAPVRPASDVPVERPVGVDGCHPPLADPAPESVEDALCELVTDAFLRTDAHGVIRRVNDAAAALLGRSAVWLRGRPIFEFVDAAQRRGARSLLNALSDASGPRQATLRLRLADQPPLRTTLTLAAVRDAHGAMIGARWLLRPLAGETTDAADADDDEVRSVPTLPPPALTATDSPRYYVDFLARASALLGSTLDQEDMLRGTARLAVPAVADWCFVDAADADGTLYRVAVACSAIEDARLVAPLSRPAPARRAGGDAESRARESRDPAARAVRERATQLVREVTPAWLADVAAGPERREALERLQPRAWLAVPLVARGQALGVLTFVMAASGRLFTPLVVGVAEELARRAALGADNARLYRQAVRASEAKSAFLATISHELRTPLTAIIGYSELLQDGLAGPLGERQADFVRRIRESGDHLHHLVEEVLGFARLQAHEERAEVANVDLGALAEQSLAVVAPLARQKTLALHLERGVGSLWIRTDPTKLRQILVNLLGNAVKFTDRGSVRLRILPPSVPGEPVVLEVADTGIGIASSMLPHVFDPFWQAEQTVTRTRGGAGLGLSVVRQLAQLLGGDVSAESEPGRGSRFRVWLPPGGPRAGQEPDRPS